MTTIPCTSPDCDWVFPSIESLENHLLLEHKIATKVHIDGSGEIRSTSSTGGQKGVKPERFDLVPVGPLTELSRLYDVGARKYADHNWRKGYEWSKSYSSLVRHTTLFWGGEDYDICHDDNVGCIAIHPETGESTLFFTEHGRGCYNHTAQHHMVCAAFHTFVLLEFKDTHPQFDDRYKHAQSNPTSESSPAGSHHISKPAS